MTITVEQHGPVAAPNFWQGREGHVVDRIVLHTMVGWIAGADARFKNPTQQASAHYGIRVDGSVWQWVDEGDTAYHAGNLDVNYESIGIEHEDGGDYNGTRPDELYAASAELVADICRRFSIPCVRGAGGPGIYDHRAISATACPDALDTDRIIAAAAASLSSGDYAVLLPSPVRTAAQEWAALYKVEAPKAGIRAEVALAQAIHETGEFTFTGNAQAEWNNPAGLGVTGAPGIGNRFASKLDGVVAHLQHLLMYFAPSHTAYCTPPTIDQRHFAHRGYPNDLRQLDGHWAVPGVGYGDAILALVPRAKALLDSV